jgi:hypothetical protein
MAALIATPTSTKSLGTLAPCSAPTASVIECMTSSSSTASGRGAETLQIGVLGYDAAILAFTYAQDEISPHGYARRLVVGKASGLRVCDISRFSHTSRLHQNRYIDEVQDILLVEALGEIECYYLSGYALIWPSALFSVRQRAWPTLGRGHGADDLYGQVGRDVLVFPSSLKTS